MRTFITLTTIGFLAILLTGCGKKRVQSDYQTTHASQSRYNDISPSEYYKEMKSDNLQYSDIAWHAKNTYGWDCEEVTNLGDNIPSSGKELNDPYLISELAGGYQVATCSSGVQLRVYPRTNTYPIITNINGGFD